MRRSLIVLLLAAQAVGLGGSSIHDELATPSASWRLAGPTRTSNASQAPVMRMRAMEASTQGALGLRTLSARAARSGRMRKARTTAAAGSPRPAVPRSPALVRRI